MGLNSLNVDIRGSDNQVILFDAFFYLQKQTKLDSRVSHMCDIGYGVRLTLSWVLYIYAIHIWYAHWNMPRSNATILLENVAATALIIIEGCFQEFSVNGLKTNILYVKQAATLYFLVRIKEFHSNTPLTFVIHIYTYVIDYTSIHTYLHVWIE